MRSSPPIDRLVAQHDRREFLRNCGTGPVAISGFREPSLALAVTGLAKITNPETQSCRYGLLITLMGLYICGWTVAYWNATQVWLFFLLGSTSWLRDWDESAGDGDVAIENPEIASEGPQPKRQRAVYE